MDISKIKGELRALVEQAECIINNSLKNDGDICQDSQRICLINALNNFEQNISGIDWDDVLNDEPHIERIDNEVYIDDNKINQDLEMDYRPVEREEMISDLISWLGECCSTDCVLMQQDLEMLIGWSDHWILSSTSTHEYISLSFDRVNFIEQCKNLVTGGCCYA